MAVTRQTLRLLRDLRAAVGRQADDAVRDLTAAWVQAWTLLAPDWRAAISDLLGWAQTHGRWPTPVELARNPLLQRALDLTAGELTNLGEQTGTAVTTGAGGVVAATAAAESGIIASQLPAAAQAQTAARAAARILPSALDAITVRIQQAITAQTRLLSSDAQAALRRELVRGIELGTNPNEAARQMLARVNGAFEGGLTRAVNVVRTEMLDAYRTTSRYAHDANADVLDGWTWLATLDGRACPSCWAMHGTTHPLSQPGPLDHQQGRCARVPRARSWRELGIDQPEPADVTPDAPAAFDALSDADQLAIMGAARLALLKSGRIGWDDLPALRDAPAWRKSYTPRSVRDLQRLADRRDNAAA